MRRGAAAVDAAADGAVGGGGAGVDGERAVRAEPEPVVAGGSSVVRGHGRGPDEHLRGGSGACIGAVLAAPGLEVWEVSERQGVTYDSDAVNPVPLLPH